MLIRDILAEERIAFSFEFFPPRTEKGWENLFANMRELEPLGASHVSVTYGAGGTTRDRTHQLVKRIHRESNITVVSHLTCVGASRAEIHEILAEYDAIGVHNILALRGDAPEGEEWETHPDGFSQAAELVAYIKAHFPHMGVGVAGFPEGHPDCPNRLKEIEYLKAKVDAGADYIVTQLFFDNRDFYDFKERCELAGISVPIIAGIMPVTTRSGMARMAELAAGARIPARLLRAVERAEDDGLVENVGLHWATEQVRDLIDNGVRGVHFYTLNKSKATRRIYESLGVRNSRSLACS